MKCQKVKMLELFDCAKLSIYEISFLISNLKFLESLLWHCIKSFTILLQRIVEYIPQNSSKYTKNVID